MNNMALGLVSSVLVTIVAVAFAWVAGKVIDWLRRRRPDNE